MKVFLTPNDKGHLTIVYPPYDDSARPRVFPGLTDDEVLEAVVQIRIEAGLQTADAPVYRDEDTNLPADHACDAECEFFRAWEWKSGGVRVNMVKAREIKIDQTRPLRDTALERESGSKFRQPPEIEALFTSERRVKLQELRDIPQEFRAIVEACDGPVELKAAWPVGLGR